MKTLYTVYKAQSTIKLYTTVITKSHKYYELIPKRKKICHPHFNVLVIFDMYAITNDI